MAELNILIAVILGAIQGITEWLPVSSSGHLVMGQHFLGLSEAPIIFDVMLHFATAIVAMIYFRKDVKNIILAFFDTFKQMRETSFKEAAFATPDHRMAWLIVFGGIPTAVIGFAFEDIFESLFNDLLAVGVALIVTGTILWATKNAGGKKGMDEFLPKNAWLVGMAQGLAIIPGISRSGSTIGIGMLQGFDREVAARYSFLLSIPTILAAAAIKGKDMLDVGITQAELLPYIAGTAVAMVVGYISIAGLLKIIRGNKFFAFAPYCWGVGIVLVIVRLVG